MILRGQIVLPQIVVSIILHGPHNHVGHMGVAKTFDAIQKTVYWPGFFKAFCACCEIYAKK